MKKVLLVLMLLLIFTIPVKAQETKVVPDVAQKVEVDGDIKIPVKQPIPVTKEVSVTAQRKKVTEVLKKVTEVLADTKPSLVGKKENTPAIIKDLPNMPDIEKLTDLAEKEADDAGLGLYGSVFLLFLATIIGVIRIKRKKKTA